MRLLCLHYFNISCNNYRRSLSPIAIRPSCLGPVKRKFEIDETGMDHNLQPPAKRTPGLLTSVASRYVFTFSDLFLDTQRKIFIFVTINFVTAEISI